jgi:uncharacterized peroxidase-related enzyme
MSWTKQADPAVLDRLGLDANPAGLWRVLAGDRPAMTAVHALGDALLRNPAPLTPAQAQMIALVVAATNGCGYLVAHHGRALAQATGDEPLARAVALDYRAADLRALDRVLLDYAVALTCEPSERKLEDVDRVREYGFDDAAIVRATALVAYMNLVSRVASGLGVDLEPGLSPWEFGSQK